jgi:hypothetical protein
MMNKIQTIQIKQIDTDQMNQINQCRGVLHTPETSNAVIARRHPFQINKKKMTDATNMSSLAGFLIAIALFFLPTCHP